MLGTLLVKKQIRKILDFFKKNKTCFLVSFLSVFLLKFFSRNDCKYIAGTSTMQPMQGTCSTKEAVSNMDRFIIELFYFLFLKSGTPGAHSTTHSVLACFYITLMQEFLTCQSEKTVVIITHSWKF